MQSNFRLVMRSGPTVGKVYPLEKGELFIGRDLSNDIVINDPEISRRHARLINQGSGFMVEDLGSTNGTFVNGQRLVGPNVLRPGDVVTFGERLSLVFESSDYDQDATIVSPSARLSFEGQGSAQSFQTPPAFTPPQPVPQYQPVSSQPIPQRPMDSYAQQVPSGYAPPDAPAERRLPVAWIVAGSLLLLSCLCLGVAAWNAPTDFWCLFPIWPAGACP